MSIYDFCDTHAGKSVVFIAAAGVLLIWPPALPWIAAVALLQHGVRHLSLSFKEVQREELANARIRSGDSPLDAPDGERGIVVSRVSVAPARSPMD